MEQGGSRRGQLAAAMIQGQQAQTNCSSKAVGTGSKGKYLCDNCDSTEKWKSSFNCPNYHIHIHQLAAKVEALRAETGRAASTTLVLPAKKGLPT
jgi:hypothetical protein